MVSEPGQQGLSVCGALCAWQLGSANTPHARGPEQSFLLEQGLVQQLGDGRISRLGRPLQSAGAPPRGSGLAGVSLKRPVLSHQLLKQLSTLSITAARNLRLDFLRVRLLFVFEHRRRLAVCTLHLFRDANRADPVYCGSVSFSGSLLKQRI